MSPASDNKLHASGFIIAAAALATTQDAIVKAMSGSYPIYETVIIRGLSAMPLLLAWLLLTKSWGALATPYWRLVLLRSLVLAAAYFSFTLALAAMPMANAVSIYFTMPFFVAALSSYALGEKVPLHRWIAIAAGFVGVLIMVRPGSANFQSASFFALASAFGYAVGQMIGRKLSGKVDTVIISNWQNTIYFVAAILVWWAVYSFGISNETSKSLSFLTRPWVFPNTNDLLAMCAMGGLSALVMMCFINAYRLAPANFVAPFEYTGMIWAVLFGIFIFQDFPDYWTLAGATIVIGAGLWMLWRDKVVGGQTTGYPAQALTARSASDD